MSFLDTIVNVGKSVIGSVTGDGIGSTLLKTVLSGYALNKMSNITKADDRDQARSGGSSGGTGLPTLPYIDRGVREQVNADQKNRVPVVYGSAQLGGVITEAVMSNSNQRMTYVLTICEKTGTLISDLSQSSFTFNDIYWQDQKIIFDTDGQTALYSQDREGNRDYSIAGLVKVYCYNGNSDSGVVPQTYSGTVPDAYDLTGLPAWTSTHMMTDLIFAVVEVNYNREKSVTGLRNVRFHVTNSMTQPGDCLSDYMKSTRYGAGIASAEIKDE